MLPAIYVVSSLVLRSPLGGLYVITPIVAERGAAVRPPRLDGHPPRHGLGVDPRASPPASAPTTRIYFLYRLREERAPHRRATPRRCTRRCRPRAARCIFVAASIGAGFAAHGLFSRFFGLRLFGTLMPARDGDLVHRRAVADAGPGPAHAPGVHLWQVEAGRFASVGRAAITEWERLTV